MWFSRYITWEVICFFLFLVFVIFIHYKFGTRDKYHFQGLSNEEIYEAQVLHSTPSKPHSTPTPQQQKSSKQSKRWKHEEECRRILESIFKCKFPSCRPNFLKSPVTKSNLELDCYNERLKLALEYDGKQHAEYTPHFHRNDKWKFIYQVRKDDWKNIRCKQEGVTLIRVPHYVPFDKLESYIRKKLQKNGFI